MRIVQSPTNAAATASADFVAVARALALSALVGGGMREAHRIAKQQLRASARVLDVLEKAGVGPTDLSALTEYESTARAFAGSLASVGIFDAMLAAGAFHRVPAQTKVASVTIGATGNTVAAGAWKPVSSFSLSGQVLAERKASAIIVITAELLNSLTAAGEIALSSELRKAIAGVTDRAFIDSIISTATPTVPAGADFPAAFRAMFGALTSSGSDSKIYLVVAPDLARYLAGLAAGSQTFAAMSAAGGRIGETPVLVSDALNASEAVLIDAASIAADSSTVTLDAARHASLALDDAPAQTAQNLINLYQTGSVALRAERFFGAEIIRAGGVVYATGLSWPEVP